ncbi:MAG: D-2-hydroxyacid dehydrogenase [Saprospiraceae bacterium]|nr:D-2-hydroxyacid dehydrogenase [Saprospiraceae bacterium]
MSNLDRSPSRRNFLKGAVFNTAALSAVPLGAIGATSRVSASSIQQSIPGLPIKIMMHTGLPRDFKSKLMKISTEIQLIDSKREIDQVDVWFGPINREEFRKASRLNWVQIPSAGVEHYLFPEVVQSDVVMTNAKGCYAPAIAEHTIGLLFALTRKIGSQTRNMAGAKWQAEDDMVEMKNLTMGIVGLGGIGSQIARRARAMDMQVIAVDIQPKSKEQIGDICDEVRLVQGDGLSWLLQNADVVVSAAPHTQVSEGMFDSPQFDMMKQGAYFINVSRGKLVKTSALLRALQSGHLAGTGLDVTDPEPLPSDHALWTLPNAIITAHISGRSQHSWNRLLEVFRQNVDRYMQGYPLLNQVDKQLGF